MTLADRSFFKNACDEYDTFDTYDTCDEYHACDASDEYHACDSRDEHDACYEEMTFSEVSIRQMTAEDCLQVHTLLENCFSDSWSLQSMEDMFRHPGYLNLTARYGETIVGYAGILAAADEADVTNVAVDPDYRRRHIARRLITSLLEDAKLKGIRRIYLEVRASNEAAVNLYERSGFIREGIRKNYYDKPKEDAIIMVADL